MKKLKSAAFLQHAIKSSKLWALSLSLIFFLCFIRIFVILLNKYNPTLNQTKMRFKSVGRLPPLFIDEDNNKLGNNYLALPDSTWIHNLVSNKV